MAINKSHTDKEKAKEFNEQAKLCIDIDESIELSTLAIELDPTEFSYWYYRGLIYTRIPIKTDWYFYVDNRTKFSARMNLAIRDFDKALSLVGSDKFKSTIHSRKAETYNKMASIELTSVEASKSLISESNTSFTNILNSKYIQSKKVLHLWEELIFEFGVYLDLARRSGGVLGHKVGQMQAHQRQLFNQFSKGKL